MVFIMLALLKPLNLSTLLCLWWLSYAAFADFSIHYAQTRLVDGVYLLDAKLDYTLTETVLEALHNGILIPLELTILIERERWYLWDDRMTKLRQRYTLKHYALSGHYGLKNLNTGIQTLFPTLEEALKYLSKLRDFPLIDQSLIEETGVYWVSLQIQLDIEALPVPLRPLAYFSSQWRLSSDWYLCPLKSNI